MRRLSKRPARLGSDGEESLQAPLRLTAAPASARTLPDVDRPVRVQSDGQDDLDAFVGDRNFVMSFARGVSVIHAFAHVSRPLSIAEISHRIHIPRAAVRRLLHTLTELGYVKAVDTRYVLTPKTLELSNAFTSSNDIAIHVQPIVTRLAERLRCFCALSVPENDETLLMCLAGTTVASVPRRMIPAAGGKAPLYATASGLLFLSTFTEVQLDAYFQRVSLLPITFRTLTMPDQVRESLCRVRQEGHAVCDRAFADELGSVAVAVRDCRGTVVGAMLAVVQAARLSEEKLRSTLLPVLGAAAQAASRRWH